MYTTKFCLLFIMRHFKMMMIKKTKSHLLLVEMTIGNNMPNTQDECCQKCIFSLTMFCYILMFVSVVILKESIYKCITQLYTQQQDLLYLELYIMYYVPCIIWVRQSFWCAKMGKIRNNKKQSKSQHKKSIRK